MGRRSHCFSVLCLDKKDTVLSQIDLEAPSNMISLSNTFASGVRKKCKDGKRETESVLLVQQYRRFILRGSL